MPISISSVAPSGIIKFTNCRLVRGDQLEVGDLWINSTTGTILSSDETVSDQATVPDKIVDIGGRIVSPGLIDVQFNGYCGFNFSELPENIAEYPKSVAKLNKQVLSTGLTSYLPTLTSQKPEVYQKLAPYLRPSSSPLATDGAESLGVHAEGPFLNVNKNGIHDVNVIQQAQKFEDLEACYGEENLRSSVAGLAPIRKITVAPECGNMLNIIPRLREQGIICSIGHSEATYKEASGAVAAGATMITHLFNAMTPLHHRDTGIFGTLGTPQQHPRPYFGIIADGIHLHPTAINLAFNAHPEGFILVTDAQHLVGLPDGAYLWKNGNVDSTIVKVGSTLQLEGTDKIAGSCVTLIECVNNFLAWSGTSIPQALKTATATPAAMLGLEGKKGSLAPGADADIVIFSEIRLPDGASQLVVDEVWKLGQQVYES
ncbi:N-acetylglucosamine-6-phosphate deacetylase [Mariannaea sp. PMI_226]|nr:N-acetylglucosamine-6-phosphate deacetylase [Mariannaea sp. PMI_226]